MQEKLPRSDYRGMMPSQHHALIFDHSSTCSDINVLTLVVLHKLQAELCRLNVSKRFWLSRTGLASSQHDAGDASRTANQPARRQYPELESIIPKTHPIGTKHETLIRSSLRSVTMRLGYFVETRPKMPACAKGPRSRPSCSALNASS